MLRGRQQLQIYRELSWRVRPIGRDGNSCRLDRLVLSRGIGQHNADRIVAERNNGGAMVGATIRMVDNNVPITTVWASREKVARAEPVSALYEQGRIHHIGSFPQLEDQMCAFTSDFDRAPAGYSPDRLDALVWGSTELLVERMPNYGIFEYTSQRAEAIRSQNSSPSQSDFIYAIGSLEWQCQQEQAGGRPILT
jgi:hypothetical protein